MNKKGVLICRVSTNKQDILPQTKELLDVADSLGFTEENLHIVESIESGTISLNDRDGTTSLMEFIRDNRDYDTIFCTEISRIGRKIVDIQNFKEWCLQNKLSLYVQNLRSLIIDKGQISQFGELALFIHSSNAQNESIERRYRTTRVLHANWGKSTSFVGVTLFGYKKQIAQNSKYKETVIHPRDSQIVKDIFNFYENGLPGCPDILPSAENIAKYCRDNNYPDFCRKKRNIKNILKNESYTGVRTNCNNILVRYPQIISTEQFQRVRILRKERQSATSYSQRLTILAKKIDCPNCSRRLSANYRKTGTHDRSAYRCTDRGILKKCESNLSISVNLTDNAVWSLISISRSLIIMLMSTYSTENHKNTFQKQISFYQSEIEQQIREHKALRFYLKNLIGLDPELNKDEINKTNTEIKKIERVIKNTSLRIKEEENKLAVFNDTNRHNFIREFGKIHTQREKVKSFINYLLDKVKVLYHCKEVTLLEIRLNVSRSSIDFANHGIDYKQESVVDDKYRQYLLIDKRNTNNIRLFRSDMKCMLIETNGTINVFLDEAKFTLNEIRNDPNAVQGIFEEISYVKVTS